MEWRVHLDIDSWDGEYSNELSDIDPGLPVMIRTIAGYCQDEGDSLISDLVTRLMYENPLDLSPSEKDCYSHAVDRFVLDAYMKAGVSEGTDCLWETIRRPGKTKCCNPYSDNMYRHLSSSTTMSVEEGYDGTVDLVLRFD